MSNIISFFQKLIKGGGWNKSGGLANFSKIIKRGGDDYSVLESNTATKFSPWVVGKAEILIRLIIVVKNKNCQAYLVCSLFFHPLRCPVDLAHPHLGWPNK